MEPLVGIELTTYSLRVNCSTRNHLIISYIIYPIWVILPILVFFKVNKVSTGAWPSLPNLSRSAPKTDIGD